jgi:hypothetical protein
MVCNISNTMPEWKDVETKFKKTMQKAKIEKIERIQNRKVWRVFRNELEDIERKNGGDANCKKMFHGTSGTDPKILYQSEEGFNLNYVSNSNFWGKALYFAENSSYSDGYAFKLPNG